MDFSFTAEQQELKDEARRWLATRYPADAWNEADWQELAELGWLGVSTPEAAGGAGLTFVEEAVIFEELGRALYPGPYFATVGLALPALPPDEQELVAAGARRWSADVGGLVVDLDKVDAVVADGAGHAAEGELLSSIDATRTLGRLTRGSAPTALPGTEIDLSRAWAALACEAVGIAQKALELGVEHAQTREQFGKPIGSFQAVSHSLADVYVETELARSIAYWAAWCVAVGDPQAAVAAAAAKSYASEAAVDACERSIQVHGGTGFTWEHVLHRYYRRAMWISQFGATPAGHRAEISAAVLA
jgi:alkylation response protein AidB-like acyl-CoA dehydrogenase